MKILALDQVPIHEWPYLAAAPRGGSELLVLPLLTGVVDALPAGLEAILALSDLQGTASHGARDGAAALLGEVIADELAGGAVDGFPDLSRVGVVLAGDLFSSASADVRGASGDVRSVWNGFAESFRWVVGVAGNHDRFGSLREHHQFLQRDRLALLDGTVAKFDGLQFAGVGLISGPAEKAGRRAEAEQLGLLEAALQNPPDVLILHEGPDAPAHGGRGNPAIRSRLERGPTPLVICGHKPCATPLMALGAGQVLNVHARAVLLRAA